MCSSSAFLPDPLVIDYSAAKAALANFSKSLSKEVGPRGICVNMARLAAQGGPGISDFAAGSGDQADEDGASKANVLLVRRICADGSIWSKVISILQERGQNGIAVQLGLRSLAEDVAWTKHVLANRPQGPTVLAGQSYGGAVISGAGITGVPKGKVIGLVFASAFAPGQGESLGPLSAMFPPRGPGLAHIQPDSQGFLWIDPAGSSARRRDQQRGRRRRRGTWSPRTTE